MPTLRVSVLVVTIGGAFLLAACTPVASSPEGTPLPGPSTSATPTPTRMGPALPTPTTDTPAGPADAQRAAEIALAAVPGAVVELEADSEGGAAIWEVGVLTLEGTGVEVYVSATTGEVVRKGDLRLDSEQTTPPAITAAEAMEIALAAEPGLISSVDLGTERGRVVWEIVVATTGGSYEFYIDAAAGDVLKQESAD